MSGSGRLKEALEQVNHAIAREARRPRRAPARGRNQFRARQRCRRRAGLQSGAAADPKNQEAYLYLGTLYAKREDYTNAEATFKKLIDADPNSFLGYYYAGRVMVAAKNYPAAEDYYAKALNLNPQSELVLLDMAMLREIEGKPKQAEELLQQGHPG